MEMPAVAPRVSPARPARSVALFGAFGSFAVANLIHNDFGLDPAIAPAALLVGLHAWRPRRGLLWGAALVIALPAFLFFDPGALGDPSDTRRFLNHLALLTAAALAVASILLGILPMLRAARPS